MLQLLPALLLILAVLCSAQYWTQELPPVACPDYFQYLQSGTGYIGKLTLPSTADDIRLSIDLTQRQPLQTSFAGKISTFETQKSTFNRVKKREPISFRIDFPTDTEVPKVIGISVNGQEVCISDEYTAPSTSLYLSYHLYIGSRTQTVRPLHGLPQIQTAHNHPQADVDFRSYEPRPQLESTPQEPVFNSVYYEPTYEPPANDSEDPRPVEHADNPQLNPEPSIHESITEKIFEKTPWLLEDKQPQPKSNTTDIESFIKNIFGKTTPTIEGNQQVNSTPSIFDQQPMKTQPQTPPVAWLQENNQPLTLNDQCGQSGVGGSSIIYGGEQVGRGEYPWLTAIYEKTSGLRYTCTGSLLSTKVVLSAAHCFKGLQANRFVVIVGRDNMDDYSEAAFQPREIQNLIVHPEYNKDVFPDADLAIMHLRLEVEFSLYIRPICLWAEDSDSDMIVGATGVVVGWGADETGRTFTPTPRKVNANIVSESECLRSSQVYNKLTSSRTICAGNRDGSGPCMGNSGSALMINRNGRWFLRGVVSAGQKKQEECDLKDYVVFCDVAKHMPWVKSNMN